MNIPAVGGTNEKIGFLTDFSSRGSFFKNAR